MNQFPAELNQAANKYGFDIAFDKEKSMHRVVRKRDNKPLVGVEIIKKRVRMFSPETKVLLFSGSAIPQAIESFLERFYCATKVS